MRFFLAVNQYHESLDFPLDYPPKFEMSSPVAAGSMDHPAGCECIRCAALISSRGGSCVIGPLGEILAGSLWDQEGIIYAEVGQLSERISPADRNLQLQMDSLDGARLDFDPVGHYSRGRLLVDLIGTQV